VNIFKNRFLNKISKNDVVKNISKLASGSLISQLVLFLTIPLLTRLYSPAEYGLQGLFVSVISIASVVFTFNYQQAIPITTKKHQLGIIVIISFASSLVVTLISLIICYFYLNELSLLLGINNNGILLLFPIGAFLLSITLILELICYKYNFYGLQSKTHVLYSLLIQSFKILGGYFYAFGTTLIMSIILGYVIKVFVLLTKLQNKINVKELVRKKCSEKRGFVILKKYSTFPLHRMPQTFLTSLAIYLPVFVLASFFDLKESGYYSLAIGVLGVPLTLLGSSVTNVLFPKITSMFKSSHIKMYFYIRNFFGIMTIMLIVPFGVFSFYADTIFSYIFGVDWKIAGVFAAALCLQYYFIIIIRPIIVAITVTNKNKFYLYFEIISSLLKLLIVFVIVNYDFSAKDFVYFYSFFSAFMSLLLICWFFIFQKPNVDNVRTPVSV
jgi:O-antigen/teichoic acid export membrane protein